MNKLLGKGQAAAEMSPEQWVKDLKSEDTRDKALKNLLEKLGTSDTQATLAIELLRHGALAVFGELLQVESSRSLALSCVAQLAMISGLESFLLDSTILVEQVVLCGKQQAQPASGIALRILDNLSCSRETWKIMATKYQVASMVAAVLVDKDALTPDSVNTALNLALKLSFDFPEVVFAEPGLTKSIIELNSDNDQTLTVVLTIIANLAIPQTQKKPLILDHNVLPLLKTHASKDGMVRLTALNCFWNISNDSETAVLMVNDKELLDSQLKHLTSKDNEILKRVLGFFGNCANSEQTHKRLKEVGLVSKLEPFAGRHDGIGFKSTRTIVLLIGAEENENMITPSSGIVDLFIEGLTAHLDTGNFVGGTWNTEEFLIPIKFLCVSDKNKPGFCQSAQFINTLIRIMREAIETEPQQVTLAVEILLQITFFYDASLGREQTDEKGLLVDLLEEDNANQLKGLLERMLSSEDAIFSAKAKQRAHSVLWALWPELKPVVETANKPKHIMLSYAWKVNKHLVERVGLGLKSHGFDVWRDEEGSKILNGISGSIDDTMAEAVENASAVVIFVSRAYKDSGNCQAEARYANKLSKQGKLTLHFVMVEDNYDPNGFLGLIMGDKLYEKVVVEQEVDVAVGNLAKALRKQSPKSAEKPIGETASTTTRRATSWTVKEVGEWMQHTAQLPQYCEAFCQAKMTGVSMKMLATVECSNLSQLEEWMTKLGVEHIGEMLHILGLAHQTFV